MTNNTYLPDTDIQNYDDLASTHTADAHHDSSFMSHTDLSYLQEHDHGDPNDYCTEHGGIVGTPNDDAHYWEYQTTPFSCAVEAQRGIIESMTGEPVTEAQLCTEAAERGWLTSAGGTSIDNTGKLMELYGVETHCETEATVGDIYQELCMGHKVITGIRAEDIWDADNPLRDLGGPGANHAVWVTGIDESDPHNIKVIINDSGDPDGAGKAYLLDDFKNAWEQSGYFYVATNKAPPDLHEHSQAFNPEQGVFTDMVDWMHDHLPDSQTLLTDMMLLSCALDLGSRVGKKIVPSSNPDRTKQSTSQIANTQATPGQSEQKLKNFHDCNELARQTALKNVPSAATQQKPPEPQNHTKPNEVVQESNSNDVSLADALKNKMLDDWRDWDCPNERPEIEPPLNKTTNEALMAKKISTSGRTEQHKDADTKETGKVIHLKQNH